jgi:hypothetical protein
VSAILAIADATEAQIQLCLHNVLDSFVFEGRELGGGFVLFVACIEEVLWAFEGAEMFGAKRWTAM